MVINAFDRLGKNDRKSTMTIMRNLIFDSILHCMQSTSASNPHLRLSEIESFIQDKCFIKKIIYLPTRHCLGFLFGWKSVHFRTQSGCWRPGLPKIKLRFFMIYCNSSTSENKNIQKPDESSSNRPFPSRYEKNCISQTLNRPLFT